MKKEMLVKKIEEVKGTEKINELTAFMTAKGIETDKWLDTTKKYAKEVTTALNEYFEKEVVKDEEISADKVANGEGLDIDMINKMARKDKTENKNTNENKDNENKDKDNDKKDGDVTPPTPPTNTKKVPRYKAIDNLIFLTNSSTTILSNVKKVADTGVDLVYSTDLSGSQIANLFLNGNLVYDPSMQRGIKENDGVARANFRDSHVRDIADAIKDNTFTATQIHLGVILDDEELDWKYNDENGEFFVNGKLRNIDGQHRTRALAMILDMLNEGKIKDVDIDKYVFNTQIHVTSAEYARIIYKNINENLKLDKSQVKQLSSDYYAKIVNELNQNSNSPLKGKIATCKPVGSKLVLFSNIAEAIEKNVKINSEIERKEIRDYLINFFDYVSYKLPQAFGNTEKDRLEFKKNNLLNENNAFGMWIKVAFLNKEEYKENIEHIVNNVEWFNKDKQGQVTIDGEVKEGYRWLLLNTVKHKQKGEGFAMNNTSNGISAITNFAVELINTKPNAKEGDNK